MAMLQKLEFVAELNPASQKIYWDLPISLRIQVLHEAGFCTAESFEDVVQEAALYGIERTNLSLRAWAQRQNSAGWGTAVGEATEGEQDDDCRPGHEAAECSDPLSFLLALEAAQARLDADPQALGRAQSEADLALRTGRAKDVSARCRVSERRVQQEFEVRREAIARGQLDLFGDQGGEGGEK
uniref:Uncharacterized protein n=1 Tax=mine drainage metagenome TaxID=410659 RepID=E6PNL6_9ZZZZ